MTEDLRTPERSDGESDINRVEAEPPKSLQQRLREFARTADLPDRERQLRELWDFLDEKTVNQEAIEPLANQAIQTRLEDAVEKTTQTPFSISDEEINPWHGSYTVLALTREGDIVASAANPVGEVYDSYGTNLLPYALKKTLARLHLELAGREGGLDNDENWAYMSRVLSLDRADRNFYEGEIMTSPIVFGDMETRLIIGGSGCEMTSAYRDSLAPGMITDGEGRVNFFAGHMDQAFVGLTGLYLEEQETAAHPVSEPPLASALRRSH